MYKEKQEMSMKAVAQSRDNRAKVQMVNQETQTIMLKKESTNYISNNSTRNDQ